MKNRNKTTLWIIVGVIVAVVVIGAISYLAIDAQNRAADEQAAYDSVDASVAIESMESNGEIADHIKGNPDAILKIVEYANFSCSHCSDMNPTVDQLVADSDGQIAVIFRNLTWAGMVNSKAAAAAAEAAGLQGYWEPYAKKLFENQSEWVGTTGSERNTIFDKYFQEVSDGKGDLEKFNKDMSSNAVEQKLKFDNGVAENINVSGTPTFLINGQILDMTNGGQLTLENGQVLTYEPIKTNAEFTKFIQQVLAATKGETVEATETEQVSE